MTILFYGKNRIANLRRILPPVECRLSELVGGKYSAYIILNRYALIYSEATEAKIWNRHVFVPSYNDGHIETKVKEINSAYFLCAVKDGAYCGIQKEDIEPLKAMFGFSR